MASPMRGWEISNAVGPASSYAVDQPMVRELGGTEDWPEAELTGGIAGIQVHAYGDDANGAWISIVGPDLDACRAAYERISGAIAETVGAWYGAAS